MDDEADFTSDMEPHELSLVDKVTSARSPVDFNLEYDEAVYELEERLFGEAFEASQLLNIDAALESLYKARDLRKRYFELLEQSARDPEHPMSREISRSRAYAIEMDNLRSYLQTIFEALLEFSLGRGSDALRLLDLAGRTTVADDLDSIIAQHFKIVAENLTGFIRRGVLDFAGARAAYDRASIYAETLLEQLIAEQSREEDGGRAPDEDLEAIISSVKFAIASNDAMSRRMQYTQQMASFDYASAVDAANASSRAFLAAADYLSEAMPGIAPFIRSSSFVALAEAGIAEASMLLERHEWDAASEMVKTVRGNYEKASRECFKSKAPAASAIQEQYLNAAFSWMVQFRRQLERERSHVTRLEEMQLELRNFYGSLRGALAPAGVTVNNATEMVTSVKQQVEVTSRVEANIRSLLREIPDALVATGIPASEKEKLSAEAIQLAEDSNGDQVTFFARAGKFARRLASALSTGAELAAPVVALLKALSVVS